jgi:signal transduction histidine kinase
MQAMVEATLAYLREGREAEEARPADLVAMLRTVCDAAADAGGEVSYRGPETLVLPLRRLGMKRALTNLVANAVSHGGGAEVVLRREADRVALEVSDRGPGIPEAELERVFEPFRRLEESRNRATGGAGLGLAIARRAVEAEGGTVRLANRPDGGVSALVILPAPSRMTARAPPETAAAPDRRRA